MVSIPKEAEPDVTVPFVYVGVSLEGISPEDSDRLLVRPLEQELSTVDGLKEITSTASEGHAGLTMEFRVGVSIDDALVDVREAVDTAKGNLPSEASEPYVLEFNIAEFPIINASLSGEVDDRVLFKIADDLQDRLEALPSVLEAKINGSRDEVAEIIIDPALMASYNISHAELYSIVSNNNQLVTAGNLDTGAGRFSFKVPGLIETEEDILNLPVKVDGDTVVHFGDIAVAQRTYKDAETYSRLDGQPSVTLEISKRVGENVIETIESVKATIEEASSAWPEGITVTYTQDKSVSIQQQLNDLFNSVMLSTLLVFIVIVWALGVRSAVLVGLAIPSSFLAAILVMSMLGITLNIVVLFALILSVGMLVDGAIVVIEYADRRMSEGADKTTAYREAATRMAWPIIASTATTLAVFMPLLFWPGIAGEFMGYLPKTVLITLSASLIMALIAIPAFGFLFGKALPVTEKQQVTINAIQQRQFGNIKGVLGRYIKFLSWLLPRPWIAMVLVFVVMLLIVVAFIIRQPGVEFFPQVDSDFGSVVVRARGNLSLDERNEIVKRVEQKVMEVEHIKTVTTTVTTSPSSEYSADTIGILFVEYFDWTPARPSTDLILSNAVAATSDIAGIIVETKQPANGPTTGIDIQLQFVSNSIESLYSAVDTVVKTMQADERFKEVTDNRSLDGLEWKIEVDREAAARFGTNVATVGSSIQMITNGLKIGTYRPDDADDEVDIRIRYPFNGRDLEQIDNLTITTQGQQVPISNFIKRTAENKRGDIFRTDGKLTLEIEANLQPGEQVGFVIADLQTQLTELYQAGQLPQDVTFLFVGDQQEQMETMAFLGNAFLVALFIMVIILVTQFNSLLQTGLILSSVVLSTVGVLVGIIVTGNPFGIVMSGVGIIALAGIVVNNNIVLIDTYNVMKRDGLEPIEAALVTCAQRARPVALTTITTILGLVPMVLQLTIDIPGQEMSIGAPSAQWWTQLSTAIAGGLTFATLLTLVLTPSMLIFIDRDIKRLIAWLKTILAGLPNLITTLIARK